VPKPTVIAWKKRYAANGIAGLEDLPNALEDLPNAKA